MADTDGDLRSRTDLILEKYVSDEDLRALVAASLESKKQARGWCPNCKKAVQVEINDAKAAVSALETLLNQAKGRPDVAQQAEDDRIVFDRVIEWGCENCQCESCVKDRGAEATA